MKTGIADNAPIKAESEKIESVFAREGIAFTRQRKEIWRFFLKRGKGATLAQAVDSLKSKRIGRATVYRTLPILNRLGLLRVSIDLSGETYYFAARLSHSHALICRSCRETIEFETCDLSVLETLLKEQTGYRILRHNLEFVGVCPKCDSIQ